MEIIELIDISLKSLNMGEGEELFILQQHCFPSLGFGVRGHWMRKFHGLCVLYF